MNIQEKEVCEINSTALENSSISGGILRGVAIMSSNISKNKRRYSDVAMEQITGFVNGAKNFIDHPAGRTSDGVRSVRDLCGVFGKGRKQGNKVTADLKVAKRFLPLFEDIINLGAGGMSINAKVKCFQNKDSNLEEIVECVGLTSCDLVSSPALTSGIFESHYKKAIEEFDLQEAVNEFLGIEPKASREEVDEFVKKVHGGK